MLRNGLLKTRPAANKMIASGRAFGLKQCAGLKKGETEISTGGRGANISRSVGFAAFVSLWLWMFAFERWRVNVRS